MTQSTLTNVQFVQSLYDAFSRGDIPTVLGAMDENVQWHTAEGNTWNPGHAFVGPQQVVEGAFARIAEEYEDFRIDLRRIFGDGDTVAVEGRYTAARHKVTGKPLDVQAAHVLDLRDGKIVHFQEYVDTRTLADVQPGSTG
jgi:hypothetical protein